MSEPVKTGSDCDICRDLAPLVQDGAASAASAALVKAHLESCAACRARFPDLAGAGGALPAQPEPDDGKVLHALRERINGLLLAFMVGGVLLGNVVMFSRSFSVFYLLIFPLVTGVAYWIDSRLWRLTPLLACAMAFVPAYLSLWAQAGGSSFRPVRALIHTVVQNRELWVLLIVLCLLGALAARLFKYAVQGGKSDEKADR